MAGRTTRRRTARALLLPILLLLTYLLSAAWALAVPVPVGSDAAIGSTFQPDEASHIAVIRFMATQRALPPYVRPYDLSVHPPLYHGLAAILYVLAAPSSGEALFFLTVRLLTALCSVGVVYLTYRAARQFGGRSLALLAASFVALVPMRASIGGGISNENLAALGAAGVLAVLAGGWFDFRRGFSPFARIALLCFYLVIGVGSKVTCLGLIPIAAISILWEARKRDRPFLPALMSATLAAAAPLVAWGWWFERNRVLYGDFFRKASVDRLWDSVQPGFASQHASTGVSFIHYAQVVTTRSWLSFWGIFDGFRTMMPWGVYGLLAAFQMVSLLGLAARIAASGRGRFRSGASLAFAVSVIAYSIFVGAVFYSYNWSHLSPQGRYYFVLLGPFGIATALGWDGLWRPQAAWRRNLAAITILTLLFVLNLWCVWSAPRRLWTAVSAKQDNGADRANAYYHGPQPFAGELRRAARPGARIAALALCLWR